jgi:type I restriction enzyme S subunit
MSNKTKSEKVVRPKLRFPEFSGDWEYKALAPYLEEYAERVSASTELPIYSSTRTGLKLQKDYFDNRELANEGEYGVVPENYFVYRHMSDDGSFKFNINKTGSSIAVSKEYPVFKTVNLSAEFLLYKLNYGDDFKQLAFEQKKGGTRTRLYLNVLRSWKTLLPSLPEQRRISNCLTSLDELIEVEDQKLDALQRHKKGLMQELFPAEGETLPKRRFPEFKDAPEWNFKPLEKVCDVLNNRRKPISSEYREKGEYPYYGASGIVDYIDDYIFNERLVLVGEDGAKWGAYEKTAFIADGKYWVNNHAHVLKPIEINDTLLENYLVRLDITPFTTGKAPPKLTLGKLKSIPIPYPKSKKEQQYIADLLSSIDDLIAAQSQKLDALRGHKIGLMQQLFPVPSNESEG